MVRDRGPGIADLPAILAGSHKSATGMGVGLLGARRLMDDVRHRHAKPGEGTTVRLGKTLPPRAPVDHAGRCSRASSNTLAADGPADAMAEIGQQNQQILLQMDELQSRQEDLQRLNQELQDTNRGVVALYAELDERADHLRRADELKSKFLSHMSHEFRTPLNSILALSRLLLARSDGELTAEQETQVRFIRKAAENLTELVDDLLDLAKVEAGKTVVVASPFTVALAVRRSARHAAAAAGRRRRRAGVRGSARPAAARHRRRRRCRRSCATSSPTRSSSPSAARCGSGRRPILSPTRSACTCAIPASASQPDDIEVIFQEFGQVAHRLQGRVKGTGLGLPLSKKLAELLGGGIAVESTPGARFDVLGHGAAGLSRRRCRTDADQDWTLEPGRIPVLLVEDDPADALAIERILADTAYQPLHARSVRDARRLMQSVQPEAILLDVMLLGDESWRLLLELRSQEASADIPLIVMSSTGEDRKAVHLGADEYLREAGRWRKIDRHSRPCDRAPFAHARVAGG